MKNAIAETAPSAITQDVETEEFHTGQVLTISGGHFFNDIYTSLVPALLPVIIDKLSLSLAMAGSLTAIQQVPGLINPFIGYLADRVSLRYFVILAPAITATLIGGLGFAPSYLALLVIFFLTGISVAAFHAPAPAMIGRITGRQVGKGMSYFMAAGELARTLGPLVAVWAISLWTLDGIWRLSVIGWATSLILYWRLRSVPARTNKNAGLRQAFPAMRRLFIPIMVFTLLRNFLVECLVTYLPVYMDSKGASLWIAGASLSILELAGVAGALSSGTFSDRLGRKSILLFATLSSALIAFLFLRLDGWVLVPILLALGFTALSTTPVLLAMVQEHLPEHRALGNGTFMLISFALRPIAILAIGFIGDQYGLTTAFFASAVLSLLAAPAVLLLPDLNK
jgi:FSR family fosmidomycin resistance protein-like MFS transporter